MPRTTRRFPPAAIEANLTPMIDVSFLLVVFFVLVTRITDAEQSPMSLPEVRAGTAALAEDEARIVLNVMLGPDGTSSGYSVGATRFDASPDGVARLAEQLAEGYRRNPRLAVHLRADRSTRYEWVEPAMRAATTAARRAGGGALPRLDLVVEEHAGEGVRDGS